MRLPFGALTAAAIARITAAAALIFTAGPAFGQGFEAIGTRPAGMGGAFVAVADERRPAV